MDHGARPDRDDDAATDVGGVVERLLRRNRSRGGMTALVGDARCAAPKTTFDELFRSVDDLAAGLIGLGVREGDRVGVASENFDRWIALDLAILSIGAVSVPRGADASTAEIAFCLGHAGCSVAFYETAELFERVRSEAPAVSATFVLRGAAPEGARTFEALLEDGRARNRVDGGAEVRARRAARRGADVATIVYTSGTTGNPKGVVLTHGNLLHNIRALPNLMDFRAGMRFLSFLPTWHTFERTVEYVCLDCGLEIHYSSKRALKADLRRVRPNFMVGVPRVWETLFQGVLESLEKLPRKKKRLVDAALRGSAAFHRARRRRKGLAADRDGSVRKAGPSETIGLLFAELTTYPAEFLARKFVYSKLKAALGGELSIAISGGGPMPADVEEFFLRAGIPFYNGYGLTETAPVVCVRTPRRNVLGTIGEPLPDTEVRIVGENGAVLPLKAKGVIQVRGPQVMSGYWNNPTATAACLSKDGWFDTGDTGMLTDRGDVMITGRAKDTIVLRGGENVEPENIETALSASPCFVDVVVVGHAQKTLAALVVPNIEVLRARRPDLPALDPESLVSRPEVVEFVRAEIRTYVSRERGFRTFEMIGRVACLPRPFTTDDGTLTHTMKKKRAVIESRYADLISSLFSDG